MIWKWRDFTPLRYGKAQKPALKHLDRCVSKDNCAFTVRYFFQYVNLIVSRAEVGTARFVAYHYFCKADPRSINSELINDDINRSDQPLYPDIYCRHIMEEKKKDNVRRRSAHSNVSNMLRIFLHIAPHQLCVCSILHVAPHHPLCVCPTITEYSRLRLFTYKHRL